MTLPPPASGWTFLKVLGFTVALLAMVGFGVCALCGVAMTIEDGGYASVALPMAGVGLAIAVGAFFGLRAILRAARPRGPSA